MQHYVFLHYIILYGWIKINENAEVIEKMEIKLGLFAAGEVTGEYMVLTGLVEML